MAGSTLADERKLVLRLFTHMRQQLDKGANPKRPHWNATKRLQLETRLGQKYQQAKDEGMTWALAADIANYAAMLADNGRDS